MRPLSRRTLLASSLAAGCASLRRGAPGAVDLSALELVADRLDRPEGVVATRDGRVIVSSSTAACTIIAPDGSRRSLGRAHHANGIAMDAAGRLIIANYGLIDNLPGILQRLDLGSGDMETLAEAIDGRALVASNFPAIGPGGDLYCTHTQWDDPRNIGTTNAAGFIYKVPVRGGPAQLVCGGIRMANGMCFSADYRHLYVAQTAAANVLRLTRRADGGFGDPRPWGPPLGAAPDNIRAEEIFAMSAERRSELGHTDGVALDVAGNLWITQPFANRVIALTPAGETLVVVSDPRGEKLDMATSIAFGGADLRDLYIASMRNNSVWKVRVGIAGLALPHWRG
jgi:gluconolactonase